MLDSPSPARNPACAPVDRNIEERTLDVPICDTGIVTATTAAAGTLPLRMIEVDAGNGTGCFMLLLEQTPVYLPLVAR